MSKHPKKILCVHQGYEMYGSDKMFIQSLEAIRINFPDAEITSVIPKKGPLYDRLKPISDTVLIKNMGVLRKSDLKKGNFKILYYITFGLFSKIKELNKYDLVYINSIVILDYIIAARFSKSKIYTHVHEIVNGFLNKFFSFILGFSKSKLIFISEAVKNNFLSVAKSGKVILNGVHSLNNSKIDISLNKDSTKYKILLIGRINSWKGQKLLIKAINKIISSGEIPNINVRIVGDVFEDQIYFKSELEELINKYHLIKYVKITPFSSTPTEQYLWSDVVVVPSTLPEPFGLVAVEAMSLGKPVIASNHGGVAEIVVHNKTGFLFEPGNEDALAQCLINLNNNELIHKFGENGKNRFNEKFEVAKYSESIINFFKE